MVRCVRAFAVLIVGSLALLITVAASAAAQSVTPVPNLDLNRLRGAWYEIAKYPYKPTKNCLNNSFELIAFGNGDRTVQIVDSCATKKIYSDPTHTYATQVKSGSGELKIRHWFIFHRTRVILAIAPDNSWFVAGSANHKDLWIYSKTGTMAAETLASVEAKAASQGFDTSRLVMTKQGVVMGG